MLRGVAPLDKGDERGTRIPYSLNSFSLKFAPMGFHTRPELEHMQYIPECKLTQIGNAINECIKGIGQYCKNVKIDEYVIMPNHVHMIVYQGGYGNPPLQDIMHKIKLYTTKRYNEINNTKYFKLWQRNFYEHIIRNEKELYKIIEYIKYNPLNWESDSNYKL